MVKSSHTHTLPIICNIKCRKLCCCPPLSRVGNSKKCAYQRNSYQDCGSSVVVGCDGAALCCGCKVVGGNIPKKLKVAKSFEGCVCKRIEIVRRLWLQKGWTCSGSCGWVGS